MGYFDDFMREEAPSGRISPNPVSIFVLEHFNDISILRSKFYSWRQIAKAVKKKVSLPPANLDEKLCKAFSRIKSSIKKN